MIKFKEGQIWLDDNFKPILTIDRVEDEITFISVSGNKFKVNLEEIGSKFWFRFHAEYKTVSAALKDEIWKLWGKPEK